MLALGFGITTAASASASVTNPQTLVVGSASQAGFLTGYLERLVPVARDGMNVQPVTSRPAYPGGVVIAVRNGVIAKAKAFGLARKYADASTVLPKSQQIPARLNTMYDLASVTKLFTATLAVQQLAKGRIRLDAPVARYLPQFAQAGKSQITIRQMLTHTSGLPPDPVPALWDPIYRNNDQRYAALYATAPTSAPGSRYVYSDINMMVMAKVVEKITRTPLPKAVRKWITGPLGMRHTMFNPPSSLRHRIAPTEYMTSPNRGMVWGVVHDENSWALGGVAGHAGLFSTAGDMAVFSQAMLNGGVYGRARIVPKGWSRAIFRDYNSRFPTFGHSLIMQTNQPHYMGAMATGRSIGHTGFTGTSIFINPVTNSFNVLLTNRVHPSRDWGSVNPQRTFVGDAQARAIAVRPMQGGFSWFSGMRRSPDNAALLTVPVQATASRSQLRFNAWTQLVPGFENVELQASADAGQSWQQLPFTSRRGRVSRTNPTGTFTGLGNPTWTQVRAQLPQMSTGTLLVRWKYLNTVDYGGRGMYVNHVVVSAGRQTVFDDARPADRRTVVVSGGFVSSRT